MARYGVSVQRIRHILRRVETFGGRREDGRYVAEQNGDIRRLYHYGTEICCIDKNTKELLSVGGRSDSDRNAINTMLDYYGVWTYQGEVWSELHARRSGDEIILINKK